MTGRGQHEATAVAGQQYDYTYDDIGNRLTSATGGDAAGENLRPASYSANANNQYTSRTVPGYLEDFGTAHSNATVTFNPDLSVGAGPQALYRHGDYFRTELAVDNTLAPLWQGMTNIGVLNNGTNADIITTNLSQVFLPATPETFLHDPDGNLTNDGRFSYTWDAENRLTTVTSQTNAPAGSKRKLTFEYDHQGRRVRLGVSVWTNNNWLVTSSNKFCYDGWNLVAELNATNNAVIRTYAWGLDLSGTMHGAGGVGGLLWVNDAATLGTNSTHLVSFDGNGNVSSLLNAADGSLSGRYEYGPFGDLTQADGLMARANPFRFSSKYHDDESDLVYYGHRYYSLTFQRWLNRDPLGEEGGLNLYGFVDNNPVNATDALGLVSSLNFVPASELAWMFGSGAAFSGGLSIGMQKLAADPCNENWLDWNKVGKDVLVDAGLTAVTLGGSKLYQAFKAGKLADRLREAETLRELGRYDELTEMLAKYGDEFGDALIASRRANAAFRSEATVASAANLGAAGMASHSKTEILRALRQSNTIEGQAVAKLLKRGKVDYDVIHSSQIPAHYTGLVPNTAAYFAPDTKRLTLLFDRIGGDAQRSAGYLTHEVRHWLQDRAAINTRTKLSELEALEWQAKVDPFNKLFDTLAKRYNVVNEWIPYKNFNPF